VAGLQKKIQKAHDAAVPLTLLAVALERIVDATCAGVADGAACSTFAAAPAVWGDAIEVPLIVFVAVSLVFQAAVMSTPGAITSTHEPTLENDASRSVRSLAATVMADGARAGEDERLALRSRMLDSKQQRLRQVAHVNRLVQVARSTQDRQQPAARGLERLQQPQILRAIRLTESRDGDFETVAEGARHFLGCCLGLAVSIVGRDRRVFSECRLSG